MKERLERPTRLRMLCASMQEYQRSRWRISPNSHICSRYIRRQFNDACLVLAAGEPFCRPATTILAARRFTSHSQGPGSVSSKSLTSKTRLRSGVAKKPKLLRCASPQICTLIPETGVFARSLAITPAEPSKNGQNHWTTTLEKGKWRNLI